MKNLNKKGFTLIELLVVIVIIGILGLIAVPNVMRFQKKASQETYVDQISALISGAANEYVLSGVTATSTSKYYVAITDIKLEKGSTVSPLNRQPLKGYIEISADSNGQTVYKAFVTDGANCSEGKLTASNLKFNDVTQDGTKCAVGNFNAPADATKIEVSN